MFTVFNTLNKSLFLYNYEIETKVKNHIKHGNISAKWMLLYTTPEAIEVICNYLIYHYAYNMFNPEFLNRTVFI